MPLRIPGSPAPSVVYPGYIYDERNLLHIPMRCSRVYILCFVGRYPVSTNARACGPQAGRRERYFPALLTGNADARIHRR
jgi:hypothetical protein